MHLSRRNLILLLCAIVISTSCNPAPRAELTVSAAISLKDTLSEASAEFENLHPQCKVLLNFASSGELAGQLKEGAPVDIFISASNKQVSELKSAGLIEDSSVATIARNSLVVIAGKDQNYLNFEDLKSAQELSIGNPKTVPVGQYAELALRKAGLYDKLLQERKLIFAENSSQVLVYVEAGDVDAGIVYNTDAQALTNSKLCFAVDPSLSGEIKYEAALVKTSTQKALAENYMQVLQTPRIQELFRKRGFLSK